MASILIAGGAGFIGSHLAKKLLGEDHTVICVDSLITGSENNLTDFKSNPHFSFIHADISDQNFLTQNTFPAIDAIFHLASPASPNAKSERSYINHPIETLLANSEGTLHLLELAHAKKAKFLFASTSEVYGDPAESPQKESYFGNVNPNGIRSVYDEAKRFGEAATFAYLRKFDTDTRIIRIFNTYGSSMQHDDGRVVSNFINQAIRNEPITIYGDGKQTRSFCYIDDMVEGIHQAMFHEKTKGEVINLGNPDERTINEIAELVRKMTNATGEIIHEDLPSDDPKKRQPDITKAKQLLGWEPKVALEEGLQKTIDYFIGLQA